MTTRLSRLNFRDLGGLPAGEGRHIRDRILYRSEGPASFEADHRRELGDLGIRLVCDLRADVERSAAPNDWLDGGRLLDFDMTNDLRSDTNEGWLALKADPSAAGARRAMRTNYAAMPGAILPHLGTLVDALIEGETPVLIHCTAGKDRTGVLVALLLLLLGTPRDVIERDYLRSDVFANNLRLGGSIMHAFEKTFGFAPSEAMVATMIGVDADFLAAAMDAIDDHWGSIEHYFEAAGVDDQKRAALRAVLTEADERG